MDCGEILSKITNLYRETLGEELVGLYLHGSLAFGCFRWEQGDIDVLAVVRRPPGLAQKMALLAALLELEPLFPPKGVEMSVVLAQDCQRFRYPTPYLLHYSKAHRIRCRQDPAAYCNAMQGVDYDLAAHFTVVCAVGRVLWGQPIGEVFGPVPRACYWDSIRRDVADPVALVAQDPVYGVLNLCRALAFAAEGAVYSKEQGGRWGLQRLPSFLRSVVTAALARYTGEEATPWDDALTEAFARWAQGKLGLGG